jgi:hypothetical protein
LETLELELDKCLGTGESVAEQKLENDQENQPANEIVPPPSAETEQGKSTEPTSKEPEKQQEPPLPSLPPNPVRDNFEFTVQTRLICEQCQHAANSEAVYRDLSLFIPNANQSTDNTATHNSEMPPPPPQGLSLNSLAEYFFSDSHVEYQCSHCKHDHAILQHRLSKLPPVLIVQLKRFDMDFERNQAIKRAEQVMIDETIQLSKLYLKAISVYFNKHYRRRVVPRGFDYQRWNRRNEISVTKRNQPHGRNSIIWALCLRCA